VANIRRVLDKQPVERMHPWYRGFEGSINEEIVKGEVRYHITGTHEIQDECTLVINELPLRSWTTDYKEFLEGLMAPKADKGKVPEAPFITDYKEYHTDTVVHFVVTMTPEKMEAAKAEGIDKRFKLTSKVSTSNMHCFDEKGNITKFANPEVGGHSFFCHDFGYFSSSSSIHPLTFLSLTLEPEM
jgi:DNA topoisomerase-2